MKGADPRRNLKGAPSDLHTIINMCKDLSDEKPRFRALKRGKQWLLYLVGNPLNYAMIKNKITCWINE